MNNLNLTEAQLRSWRPRPPAAGLKRKLPAAAKAPRMTWFWGGLAPALACVCLTLIASTRDGDRFDAKPMMGLGWSNQTGAAYAWEAGQAAQNHLAALTFDWTNRSAIQSIMGFRPTTNFSN